MYKWSIFLICAVSAFSQTFNSGSSGADGDLTVNTPGVTMFSQTPVGGSTVFNFKSIQIAAGSTLKLSGQIYPTPLGHCDIGTEKIVPSVLISEFDFQGSAVVLDRKFEIATTIVYLADTLDGGGSFAVKVFGRCELVFNPFENSEL